MREITEIKDLPQGNIHKEVETMKKALTEKETKAIKTIQEENDIMDDGACFADPSDLIRRGYSKHEAAGMWSALMEIGLIALYEDRPKKDGGNLFVLYENN